MRGRQRAAPFFCGIFPGEDIPYTKGVVQMRSGIYLAGVISVVILLALAFQLLPPPWEGGVTGWFCALWYLCALSAGLGYWYKYDKAKAKEERLRRLREARRRQSIRQTGVRRGQQSF